MNEVICKFIEMVDNFQLLYITTLIKSITI